MGAVTFDTLKLATKLEQSGFTSDQAKGAATALADAFGDEMVTKSYLDNRLQATKADLDARLQAVKADLDARLVAIKADTDTRLEATKADILKWMFGTIGFQTIIILGAVVALSRLGR